MIRVALALVGCGTEPVVEAPPAPVAVPAPVVEARAVVVQVDGVAVGSWTPTSEGTDLVTMLPADQRDVAAWASIRGTGGGRAWTVSRPGTSYGEASVRLFLTDGRSSVGVFRTPAPGASAEVRRILAHPTTQLVGVEVVDVTLAPPEASAPEAPPLPPDALVVARGDQSSFIPAELVAESMADRRNPGLELGAAVKSATGDAPFASVGVTAGDRPPIEIPAAELDGRWTLRRNSRGDWVLRKAGDTGVEEFRPIVRIDVRL